VISCPDLLDQSRPDKDWAQEVILAYPAILPRLYHAGWVSNASAVGGVDSGGSSQFACGLANYALHGLATGPARVRFG